MGRPPTCPIGGNAAVRERPLLTVLGAIGVYAPNFSWKKSRIAAHERLSVFSL
jgi:hypothetical protein